MTSLKPFGVTGRKTSKRTSETTSASLTKTASSESSSPQKLKPFGSTGAKSAGKSHSFGTKGATGREPKLSTAPWNERLKYLVQLGYMSVRRGDWWVICDRFSNAIKEDGMTIRFGNPIDAQKYADARNEEFFQLRLKELTGRV